MDLWPALGMLGLIGVAVGLLGLGVVAWAAHLRRRRDFVTPPVQKEVAEPIPHDPHSKPRDQYEAGLARARRSVEADRLKPSHRKAMKEKR